MDLNSDQLLRIAFDAAVVDGAAAPPELWARVTARVADSHRPPQHPAWNDPEVRVSSLRAFIETGAEVADLLATLAPEDWALLTSVQGVTVRGLVEHLVGVERYVLGQLGRRPPLAAPRREDHWSLGALLAADVHRAPTATLSSTWWTELLAVVAAAGEVGPDHPVSYHHLAGSLRGLLVIRTFELWTHGDDIRAAVSLPLNRLDDDRLSMMVNQLIRVLPLGLALTQTSQSGRTARLRLTGPGGGSFDVPLSAGELPGQPDLTLTADVIDLCRLAAGRLSPADLDAVISGDGSLLEPLLTGAMAFAAD
jgi:uncharacterized protein (TIGR03083 family)